jgi:hypothetical protein
MTDRAVFEKCLPHVRVRIQSWRGGWVQGKLILMDEKLYVAWAGGLPAPSSLIQLSAPMAYEYLPVMVKTAIAKRGQKRIEIVTYTPEDETWTDGKGG